jgi:hypothetical protein
MKKNKPIIILNSIAKSDFRGHNRHINKLNLRSSIYHMDLIEIIKYSLKIIMS